MRQESGALVMFPIRKQVIIVGSDMTCDIILNYPGVLPHHTRLSWDGDRFVLEDLNSTTGTLLNGASVVAPQPLKSGDAIAIGKVIWFRFQIHPTTVFPEELLHPGVPTSEEKGVVGPVFQRSLPEPEPEDEAPAAPPKSGKTSPLRRRIFVGLGCLFVALLGIGAILLIMSMFPSLPGNLPTLAGAAPTLEPIGEAQPPLQLGLCAGRYGPAPSFVVDLETHQPPDAVEEPPAHQPFIDSSFHTCVVRVTDRAKDISSGDSSTGLRNGYAHVNAFNADNSRLLAQSSDFSWYLYDVATLQLIGHISPQGQIDPRWDSRNPFLLYTTPGIHLNSFDLNEKLEVQLHDFSQDLGGYEVDKVWGRFNSNPSFDGRRWVFAVEGREDKALALLTFDKENDRVVGLYDLRQRLTGEADLREVTVSPRGNYVVASYTPCSREKMGTYDQPCGLMLYSPDLKSGQGAAQDVGAADVALDSRGREVVVYQDNANLSISMLDLETRQPGAIHKLDGRHLPGGMDICGRAVYRPGWALISAYDDTPESNSWLDDQVLALELTPQGRVVHLAHTNTLADPDADFHTRGDPRASTNADFTRVLFTSNWRQRKGGLTEMYVIELPPDWIEKLPAQMTLPVEEKGTETEQPPTPAE